MRAALVAILLLAAGCEADAGPDTIDTVNRDGRQFCTGTLIAPDVVLTAAHCVVQAEGRELDFGGVRVVAATAHPAWRDNRVDNDVGILVLERNVDVPVAELATELPAEGAELEAVGYHTGDRTDSRFQVRKVVASTVYLTAIDGAICRGDSGGPSFIGGRLVGVHSRAGCDDVAIDEAVAPHLGWIGERGLSVVKVGNSR